MWELESAAPPADPEARQIQVTLAQSRARYVSPDLEFAVWAATIGEGREGEPVTVVGPLGHVTAGGVNGLCRRFLRVSRQRFAPPAGSFAAARAGVSPARSSGRREPKIGRSRGGSDRRRFLAKGVWLRVACWLPGARKVASGRPRGAFSRPAGRAWQPSALGRAGAGSAQDQRPGRGNDPRPARRRPARYPRRPTPESCASRSRASRSVCGPRSSRRSAG